MDGGYLWVPMEGGYPWVPKGITGGYPWVPKGITRKYPWVWVGLGLRLNSMGIFGLGTLKGFLFWVVLGIKPVGKIPALIHSYRDKLR